jgi:hypothetical protein
MTARVQWRVPNIPNESTTDIGYPVTAGQLDAFAKRLAHLLGACMPHVVNQAYGPDEQPQSSSATTLRFRHEASANAKHIVFAVIPRGYTSGSSGTISLASASTDSVTTYVDESAITDLYDCSETFYFIKDLTASSMNQHVFTFTACRPHSIEAWECPVSLLKDAEDHVDASVANAGLKISDSYGTADARGWSELCYGILRARTLMRRHPCNTAWPIHSGLGAGGLVSTSNSGYIMGTAAANDGVRLFCRGNKLGTSSTSTGTELQCHAYVTQATQAPYELAFSTSLGTSYATVTAAMAAALPVWVSATALLTATSHSASVTDELKVYFTANDSGSTLRLGSVYAHEEQ